MLTIYKKSKNVAGKLFYSAVYSKEILGVMYGEGEFLLHARITILKKTSSFMAGVAFRQDDSLHFVASHPQVMAHIEAEGAVPLVQGRHLCFFKDKRKMNEYLKSTKL
ncbi:hypothetical protein [Bacillus sp. 1P06AnD]|uniref:hypothetical protein n=1 Tax=Bacillus sp. 1P06AnD TaxID=3132208 RepID=UPI0039A155C9